MLGTIPGGGVALAERLADEIIFIHDGRVLERAGAEQFFSGPSSRAAAAFIKGELL